MVVMYPPHRAATIWIRGLSRNDDQTVGDGGNGAVKPRKGRAGER